MVLGGLGEWILGNTFPFVVFTSFGMFKHKNSRLACAHPLPGAYWLSFAFTLIPFYNASIAYDPSNPTAAATNAEFAATFGKTIPDRHYSKRPFPLTTSSVLPAVHGSPLLRLSNLLSPHKPLLLRNLLLPRSRLHSARRSILPDRERKLRCCRKIAEGEYHFPVLADLNLKRSD